MSGAANQVYDRGLSSSDAILVVMFALTILVVIYLVFLRRSSSN